ncbi:MAG: TonB-dependent receptor, partial [Pseudomonadota bacterium]
LEYYFSESGFASIGFFHKERSDVFTPFRSNPAEPIVGGSIERDITAPCEDGGIFNPVIVDRQPFSSVEGIGICVPLDTVSNAPNDETQTGVELALQYNLSAFEDVLGWASGFGVIANYTYQEAGSDLDVFLNADGSSNGLNNVLGRTDSTGATPTLDDDVVQVRAELPLLSENSYNITLFYDKYDISVRARYTWRSEFFTAGLSDFGLPRVVGDRGQLNLSASYNIRENITIGLDVVDLINEEQDEFCVNEGGLLCSQLSSDRRILAGVSARF